MADINVERKGPSIWPWIVGLLVLALLVWAIAEMMGGDDEVAQVDEVEEVAVPAPLAVPPAEGMMGTPMMFRDITPLGPEDQGQLVQVSGSVVGEPTANGYWLRTAENNVIWVRTNETVTAGQTTTATGMLRQESAGQVPQITAERGWTIERDWVIDATQTGMTGTTGTEPATTP